MDDTKLIEWSFPNDNMMVGTLEKFYVLIRNTTNTRPYELRIFHNGEIILLASFSRVTSAVKIAQEYTSKYYRRKNDIRKPNVNNIINIEEWRESHGSKK